MDDNYDSWPESHNPFLPAIEDTLESNIDTTIISSQNNSIHNSTDYTVNNLSATPTNDISIFNLNRD